MNAPLKPLKRFGQNFLVDKNILKKILEAVRLTADDDVLEIGPGDGALTLSLAKRAKSVLAIEIDRGRWQALKENTRSFKNLDIQLGDFLKFDLKASVRRKKIKTFVVVANIPYYITTPILERLLDEISLVKDIYLTVQREVAERFLARPGTGAYGSLSCFVQYFTDPKILFPIKARSFWPAPKVDSCFIRLAPYSPRHRPWSAKDERKLFEVIRAAFGQRRKTLASSLSKVAGKDALRRAISSDMLSRRPETLGLADFVAISDSLT